MVSIFELANSRAVGNPEAHRVKPGEATIARFLTFDETTREQEPRIALGAGTLTRAANCSGPRSAGSIAMCSKWSSAEIKHATIVYASNEVSTG